MKLATSGTATVYRIGIVLAVLALIGGVAFAVPAGASADMDIGSLDVADANETVDQNVSDVVLSATLDYQHDVPDAERRIVKLKAGPSEDDLELVDYQQARDPAGTASGSVTLGGSVIDATTFTTGDFQPDVAGNTSQEIVVEAVIEVERATGDTVRHTVTDTATVHVQDGTELVVELGGSGSIDVQT